MKAKCNNGCFEREIPEKLKDEIKKDERSLVCAFCFKSSITLSE